MISCLAESRFPIKRNSDFHAPDRRWILPRIIHSGIIVELKYTKEFERMEQACQKAIAQIKNQRYYEYLLNDDRRNILFYGITFCKKRCKVIVERINM